MTPSLRIFRPLNPPIMRGIALLSTFLLGITVNVTMAQSPNTVDVATLQAELAKGGVQLVDVRTPQEWNTGHIQGALHIDWFSDDFKSRIGELDKKKPVRLYCAAGGRSEDARNMLREMGFKEVLDLDGGMSAWKKAGAPVEK